ncbi:unnamed protein product [Nippostrongylus brasiliensis]|uniref:Uncharacterized protein n=1 Tax=Nippostrongylus brasiliensis TaxID=27835 RepID=A0A0N4Y9F7_NIPBR|nr:unnamed protein product [Nippostrongylus brasiliensis]
MRLVSYRTRWISSRRNEILYSPRHFTNMDNDMTEESSEERELRGQPTIFQGRNRPTIGCLSPRSFVCRPAMVFVFLRRSSRCGLMCSSNTLEHAIPKWLILAFITVEFIEEA